MSPPTLAALPLYYHTASRMQPRQLSGIAMRKAREAVLPRLPVDFDARYARRVPETPDTVLAPLDETLGAVHESLAPETRARHREAALEAAAGEVTFLSETVSFPDGIDWADDALMDRQELWWELLFAFDPLWRLVTGVESPESAPEAVSAFDEWLDGWIRSVRTGGPGYLRGRWTPYCVSLRLRYWLCYLAWRGEADALHERVAREAYKNALFLAKHVEWDVGGNHLVENGTSLVLAGVALDEPRWRRQGCSVLERAATTQFLADGGHFERSPMYHVATTLGYLLARDTLRRGGHPVPDVVERTARAAVGFCHTIRPPDGRIPLLNDAAYGYTLPLEACLRYADRTGVDAATATATPGWGDEPTGYRWLRTDAGAMLVDGGPVGPDHLPGHSHNDLLSVCLWVDDHRVLTDTGVNDYEDTPSRQYARSVRAHNTVQVGDGEPIPVGGKYLMGRRTRPTTTFSTGTDGTQFAGRYEGHPAGAKAYTHHREIRTGDDWWALWDRVEGADDRPVRSRLHCHPDVDVSGEHPVDLVVGDGPTLVAHPLGDPAVRTERTFYYPRFGDARERTTLVATGEPSGWLLTTRTGATVEAVTDADGRLGALTVA